MRHLIWYLRTAFCNHDWNYDEVWFQKMNGHREIEKQGNKVSATCKKCGWHRTYWKHH